MRGRTHCQRLTVLAFLPILVATAPCASEAVGAEPATTLEELASAPSVLFDAELFQPDVEGHRSFILKPRQNTATTNRPWVWYAPTLLADNERAWRSPGSRHAWMFKRLLAGGVYVAGVDVGESYGSPKGRSVYQKFYQMLVRHYGFSAKPVLLPISRGGLMAYNWAAEHPDCVGGIGAVYPVCNLRTYPPLEKLAGPYGMSAQKLESQFEQHNPLARLAPLAAARVPILHVHGDNDRIVPLEKNSAELAARYKALGGSAELIVVPGKGHEVVPELWQEPRLVEFLLKHSR